MIEFNKCVRCGSENIEKLKVNTRIDLNYPEEKQAYSRVITQKIVNPTDALFCNDCGHIELFIDIEKD